MKKLLTAVLALLSIALFSCQKEVGDLYKTTGSQNPAGTLKRTVIKQGSDSSVTDYWYNNSGKLSAVNDTTTTSGLAEFNNQSIERNSQNMIQKIVTKASQLSQIGVDSMVAIVNSASGRYTNRVVKVSALGQDVTLTSVYSYDANGKIVSQKDYVDDGAGNIDSSRTEYTYTGANLISLKAYSLNSGSATPDLIQVFEYDAKLSPLPLGNEAFVLNNFTQWTSANNLAKITVNVAGDPDTHIETWNYTYNSSNKPINAAVVQDGQAGITMSYFYN